MNCEHAGIKCDSRMIKYSKKLPLHNKHTMYINEATHTHNSDRTPGISITIIDRRSNI